MTHPLHEKAKALAHAYKQQEAALIEILQQIESEKVFALLGYPSLYAYATRALGLSESRSYEFINVARLCKRVPEVKAAIETGRLGVSKARRLSPVVSHTNAGDWISKAIALPQRELEKVVAQELPAVLPISRLKAVANNQSELTLTITLKAHGDLERARELISQVRRKNCSLGDAVTECLDFYLKHKDQLRRQSSGRLGVRQAVIKRDEAECQARLENGEKCKARHWVHLHHKLPRVDGGADELENMEVLCAFHHRQKHR